MATQRRHGALFVENFAQKHRPRARPRHVCVCHPSWPFQGPRLSYVRLVRVRIGGKKKLGEDGRPPFHPPPPSPSNSSTPFASRATLCLVDGDGAIIPRQFFSDAGSLYAGNPPNFSLFFFLSSPFTPFHSTFLLVPLLSRPVRFARVLRLGSLPPEGRHGSARGSSALEGDEGARESGMERVELSNGTINDEREAPRRDAGSISCLGGSFFGETRTGMRVE